MDAGTSSRSRQRANGQIAVLLQCIPLLGAASCVANAASNQHASILPLLLWWSVVLGGFGYLYLRRWVRFLLVLLAGPALAFAGVYAVLNGSFDYEHCPGGAGHYDCEQGRSVADATAAGLGLLAGAMVTVTAVDAARLAERQSIEAAEAEGNGSSSDGTTT